MALILLIRQNGISAARSRLMKGVFDPDCSGLLGDCSAVAKMLLEIRTTKPDTMTQTAESAAYAAFVCEGR